MGCPDAELSIVVTGDEEIRSLNRAWRGKDRPTDVLSFSQLEVPPGADELGGVTPRGRPVDPRQLGPRPVLGDVIVSAETALRQAARYGHDLTAELERLLVHGTLHLLGHDHVHGGLQARRMRTEERRLERALRRSRTRRAAKRTPAVRTPARPTAAKRTPAKRKPGGRKPAKRTGRRRSRPAAG